MANYDVLFTPFKIGSLEIRNRIVEAPHGTNAANGDGTMSDNKIDFYARRAQGGVGMIIEGCTFISQELASGCIEGAIEEKFSVPRQSVLVEAVHRHGAKIAIQLSCGVGRNAFPSRYKTPMSASAIPATLDPSIICKEMDKDDIARVMNWFTNAASNAAKAGFDAIEIHAHAGYLIDQFLSPCWNHRTDEYGGSVENRCRFAIEAVQACRKGARADMPIIVRISLDHRFPGGRTLEDSIEILKVLEKAGVDAFDVDAGSYETIDYIFPPAYLGDACMAYVTKAARQAVSVPIMNSGNHTPETAAALIESGDADFVMFARGLIADPDLPKKLMEGRREDVRPCIRCNEDCIGRTGAFKMAMLSCAVNTEACQERWMGIPKTENPKKVCVIGAGPAGLEAARTATLSGHKVTLFEAADKVGGMVTAAETPSFKGQLKALIKYYEVQMEKLGVDLRLNTFVSADSPELEGYDKYIVAVGSEPFTPPIPGMDRDNVITVQDAHRHKEMIKGDNIVICGGGQSGCDCALELAEDFGKCPAIVEMAPKLSPDLNMMSHAALDRLVKEYKLNIHTSTKVKSVEDDGVHVLDADGNENVLPADTVISAFGLRKLSAYAEAVRARFGWRVRIIGDCDKVGRIGTAVRGGYFAGTTIDD